MHSKSLLTGLALLLAPSLLQAASPDKPKPVDAFITNEPTVHVGSSVDVNVTNVPAVDAAVTNEPTVHVGSSVVVDAYQAGEWVLTVESAGTSLKEFTGNIQSTDGWVEVYQVPEGKRLVVTDINLNQRTYGSWLNTVQLNRNREVNPCGIGTTTFKYVHLIGLEDGGPNQVHYPLATGYEFTEGERICIAQSGGGLVFYNLSGYEVEG